MSIDLSKIDPALRGLYSLGNAMEKLKRIPEDETEKAISAKEFNELITHLDKILEAQLTFNRSILDKVWAIEDKKSRWRFWKLWLL